MKVLFICTGNIFRSMCAKYLLRNFLQKNNIKNIEVSSAGTQAIYQEPLEPTKEYFRNKKIDNSKHVQRKLTKKILNENDVIVAMSTDHRKFIKENFDLYIPLFNQICYRKKTPFLDVN